MRRARKKAFAKASADARGRPIEATAEIENKNYVPTCQELSRVPQILRDLGYHVEYKSFSIPVTHYFDTEDLLIYHNGLSLRRREANAFCPTDVIAVKTHGDMSEGGTLARGEFEDFLHSAELDIRAFTHPQVNIWLAGLENEPLFEYFKTTARRKSFHIETSINGKKVVIDLGLDNVRFDKVNHRKDTYEFMLRQYEIEFEVVQKESDPRLTQREAEDAIEKIVAGLKKELPRMYKNSASKLITGFKQIGVGKPRNSTPPEGPLLQHRPRGQRVIPGVSAAKPRA